MTRRVGARIVLVAVVLVAIACNSGREQPPDPLEPPPVSPTLFVRAQGTIVLDVAPAAAQSIDPVSLAVGGVTPDCSKLVFLFSWRVDNKESLAFVQEKQGGSETKLLEGGEGILSVPGCGMIIARNSGKSAVTGELRYVIAEMP